MLIAGKPLCKSYRLDVWTCCHGNCWQYCSYQNHWGKSLLLVNLFGINVALVLIIVILVMSVPIMKVSDRGLPFLYPLKLILINEVRFTLK